MNLVLRLNNIQRNVQLRVFAQVTEIASSLYDAVKYFNHAHAHFFI